MFFLFKIHIAFSKKKCIIKLIEKIHNINRNFTKSELQVEREGL